jgi:hypothetical protein
LAGHYANDKYRRTVARDDSVIDKSTLVCFCPPIENDLQAAEYSWFSPFWVIFERLVPVKIKPLIETGNIQNDKS